MIYSLAYEFGIAPVVIQIALLFIFIAVVITVASYALILLRRWKGFYYDKRQKALYRVIDDYITDAILLNDEITEDSDPAEINLDITPLTMHPFNKRRGRQALIERLMDYRKKMGGIKGMLLTHLFCRAGLDKDCIKKLHSGMWNRQEQALNELTTMEVVISNIDIFPLTISHNRELRTAARQAFIKLTKHDAFRFFDAIVDPISMWDQIILFKIITTTDGIAIPNFGRWINYSTNNSLILFCLKLVVHYQQLSAVPAVISRLNTRDHELRAEAIACLGILKVEEAEDLLAKMYTSQPVKCQIEILKALGRIGTGKYLSFLKEEFLYSSEFEIRKQAVRALLNSRWMAEEMIQKLIDTASPRDRIFLNHCMNPLIMN